MLVVATVAVGPQGVARRSSETGVTDTPGWLAVHEVPPLVETVGVPSPPRPIGHFGRPTVEIAVTVVSSTRGSSSPLASLRVKKARRRVRARTATRRSSSGRR